MFVVKFLDENIIKKKPRMHKSTAISHLRNKFSESPSFMNNLSYDIKTKFYLALYTEKRTYSHFILQCKVEQFDNH